MTEKKQKNKKNEINVSDVRIGDTIKIYYKFKEKDKDKERVQAFEGVVIARKGAGISETMTIRGVAAGFMMEKIIPVNSPNIQKIEIVKRGKVRRAKLYYLRAISGKKAKLKRRIEKVLAVPEQQEDTEESSESENQKFQENETITESSEQESFSKNQETDK